MLPVRNGNLGNDRTTKTKATSVRKIARVTMADRSAEELDREIGEEQAAVGRTLRKDGGWQTTEEREAELR